MGYIIAGTFLFAAVGQGGPAWLGRGAWVLVGLAAAPARVMWACLARRRSRPTLIAIALVVQAAGTALPGLYGGAVPAVISAVLFGNTFMAVSSLTLAAGTHLRFPRSVALLTAGYGVGQTIGPLVAKPLLAGGYRDALLVGAAVMLAAAAAAGLLRIGYPGGSGTRPIRPSRGARPPAHLTSSA